LSGASIVGADHNSSHSPIFSGFKIIQDFTKLLHENEVDKGRKGLLLIALAMAGTFHASCRVEQGAVRLIRRLRGFGRSFPIGCSSGITWVGAFFALSLLDFDNFQTAASRIACGLAWSLWL
jgi:hypothetical protein